MDANTEIEAISAEISELARRQAELHKRRVELGYITEKMRAKEQREAKLRDQGGALRQSRDNWLRSLPFEQVPLEDMQAYSPSVRLANVLKNNGIKTVGDVLKATPDFIRELPNAGKQTVEEFAYLQDELDSSRRGWFIRR